MASRCFLALLIVFLHQCVVANCTGRFLTSPALQRSADRQFLRSVPTVSHPRLNLDNGLGLTPPMGLVSLSLSSMHAFLSQDMYSELLFLLHLMQRRWTETKFDLPLDKVQRGRSLLVISKELYVNEHLPIWEDTRNGIPPAKSLRVHVFFLEAFIAVARACLRRYIYSIFVVEGERERQSYNSDSHH
jgi:hypothetical protein